MKLLTLFALALALHAEDAAPSRITGATVTASYLLVLEYPKVSCAIEGMHGPRVIVYRGTPQQCWEATIHEHNLQMGNRSAHLNLDESLEIEAAAFGKHFKADAR